MATTLASQVQELYIGYLGRAADKAGLDFWVKAIEDGTSTLESVALGFTQSAEYQAAYANLTNTQLVAHVYQNVLGRAADADGLTFWVGEINKGVVSADTLVKAMINSLGSIDQLNMDNKVQAANEYTQAAGDNYVLADAKTAIGAPASNNPGQTYTLTTGIDNVAGTSGNDTINGSDASGATALVLGGLDVIDGGAGTDTLKIADAATAAGGNFSFNGATIKNVENIEVTTNGSFDVAANTGLSLTGYTGLTSATLKAAGTDNSLVLAAATTDVNLTVAGTATAGVTGGKAVSVTAGTGVVTVAGDALTSVTVKGGTAGAAGGTADVTNTVSGAGNTGATLKSVTIDGVATGGAFEIAGAAVDTVTVKNQQTALATAITNATSTSLTVNVDAAGYTAAGATVAGVTVAAGAAATTINLNAVSKSNVAVSGAAATTLNITGAGALTLSAPITTATKIDGSAATGALTLGVLDAATVNVSTGSGNDSLTLAATAKATVATGAGDDTVTLNSALFQGSTINLGAGNDKLLDGGVAGLVNASTATAVTTIDAGDGTDTLAASLINAANAAQFKNFENIDVSSATVTALDVELMTGSTITGLTLTGGAGGATVNNVAAGVGLSVSGSNTGSTTIGVKGAATGTADSFTTTFVGEAAAGATALAPTTIAAGTVVTDGVESLNVVSSGTGFVTNTMAVTDSALQKLTITGDKGLALTFAGTNGTAVTGATDTVNGVKLIDGSAATGVLNINTANVTNVANAGLTVKTGSANDVITLAQKATVDAGAGNDTITSAAAGGSFTGGAGNDKFDIKAAVATGATEATAIKATITDIAVGDTIVFDAAGTAFAGSKIALDATVTNLDLALAAASNNSTAGQINWFQYGANTYIVENVDGTTGIDVGDVAIKLNGLVDLSNATYNATTDILTIA